MKALFWILAGLFVIALAGMCTSLFYLALLLVIKGYAGVVIIVGVPCLFITIMVILSIKEEYK